MATAPVQPDVRKDWDLEELMIAGAIDVEEPLPLPSISRPLHPLFAKEKWKNISDQEFNLLLPSLRLASNLVAAGTTYFAEFLANPRLHDDLRAKYRARPREEHVIKFRGIAFTDDELDKTRNALDEVAKEIKWTLNRTLANSGALGMTRHIREGPYAEEPWGPMDPDEVLASDGKWKRAGLSRRPLLVGIMYEYIDALRKYAPGTEFHTRALFHAAVTIAHEVGHVVWCQDFRSDASFGDMGQEPWVADWAQAELGFAFEAYLFSGYHVRAAKMRADVPLDFESAAVWNPYLTIHLTRTDERLLYREQFSISVEYMQRLLSQEFWAALGNQKEKDFSAKAIVALKPETDLTVELPPATANVRNWTVGIHDGKPAWLHQFIDRGNHPSLAGKIPLAEINQVKEELRPFYKKSLSSIQNPFGEDDDEDFDFDEEDEDFGPPGVQPTEGQIHQLMAAKEPYIHDGVVTFDYQPKTADEAAQLGTELTLVEVKYTPPTTVKQISAKRARAPDDDEDEYYGSKREKPNFIIEATGEAHSIDEMLEKNSPTTYEQWTREEGVDYALESNFEPGPSSGEEAILRSRLSMGKKNDKHLIERIRCFHFNLFEKAFVDDTRALIMIKKARIESFDRWAKEDMIDLLKIQGQITMGTDAEIKARGLQWLRLDMADLVDDQLKAPAVEPDYLKLKKDYDNWSPNEFKYFFKNNNLPEWGDLATRKLRVQRFRDQQSSGHRPDRNSILINKEGLPQPRVSPDGIEKYRFDVVLERSTIAGLKSDLFRVAKIPSNHDINLYFKNDRTTPLEDKYRLEQYDPADWTALEMTTTVRKGADPVPQNEIAVYVPVVSKTKTIGGSIRNDVMSLGGGGGGGGKLIEMNSTYKRDYDIRKGTEQPTLSERMSKITERGQELQSVMQAGGGIDPLRPHLKAVLPNSAVEMLDTMDHNKEIREEREGEIDKYVDEFGKAGAAEDDWGGDGNSDVPAKAPEHMRDLFERVRGTKEEGRYYVGPDDEFQR